MVKATYIPIKEIVSLARQGYNDATIVKKLREEGYTPRQINDAFNQAKIKTSTEDFEQEMEPSIMSGAEETGSSEEIPTPTSYGAEEQLVESPIGEAELGAMSAYPQYTQYPYPVESRPSTEVIEEIAEEIINEKWRDFKTKAGDFRMLKRFFESHLKSLALRMKKMETAMDKIQDQVIIRIRDNDSELRTLRAELHALETAFSKILEPLVTNIRKIEQGSVEKELTRLKKKEKEEKLESKLSRKRKRK